MSAPLLDPRNDFVFKKLFANHLPLLTDLINAVRSAEPPVTVVSVQNPRIDAETLAGKFIVLDILALDANGHYYNIEMQINQREQWSARSMVYLAKTLAAQLKAGDNYAELKPVIGIHLLGYDLFPEQNQALWCFEMRDSTCPAVRLGREMQLNIVELSKADRLAKIASRSGVCHSALAPWIMYFEHWKDDSIMNAVTYPPVLDAMAQLKALSADEETRYLAEQRELALFTERTEINAAIKRGETLGEARTKEKALQRMIESGIPEGQARAILNF